MLCKLCFIINIIIIIIIISYNYTIFYMTDSASVKIQWKVK